MHHTSQLKHFEDNTYFICLWELHSLHISDDLRYYLLLTLDDDDKVYVDNWQRNAFALKSIFERDFYVIIFVNRRKTTLFANKLLYALAYRFTLLKRQVNTFSFFRRILHSYRGVPLLWKTKIHLFHGGQWKKSVYFSGFRT